MEKCAPSKKFSSGSCFTIESLKKIAETYNGTYNDKIETSIINSNDKKTLLKALTIKMAEQFNCNDQLCWMSTKVVRSIKDDDIKHNTFRPNGPENMKDWLGTSDINNVMRQYESKYPEFKFFGAVPYDFEELPYYEVSQIDFNDLDKSTYKFGLVINLDEHNKPGSHWVALYVNLKDNIIYYFDSFGKKPGKRINTFVRKILTHMYNKKFNENFNVEQFLKKFHSSKDYDVRFNHIQHQFKNTECGVYSMNFIIRLLGGETFDHIINNITNDDDMNNCRKTYFKNN